MGDLEKFSGVDELYKRVLPALQTKISELKREKIEYIKAIDIWQYCIENIWKNKSDLRIYELVDDILNVDSLKLELYIKRNITNNKINKRND